MNNSVQPERAYVCPCCTRIGAKDYAPEITKSEIMLENATDNSLGNSSKQSLDNWQSFGTYNWTSEMLWTIVRKYHWTSIGKCHWISTMISEVLISGVQYFAPSGYNMCICACIYIYIYTYCVYIYIYIYIYTYDAMAWRCVGQDGVAPHACGIALAWQYDILYYDLICSILLHNIVYYYTISHCII